MASLTANDYLKADSVENILKRYRVNDFFSTMITEEITKQTRHVGRGRPSKNSPIESETRICLLLHIQLVDDAIQISEILAGWRLYLTNAPTTKLTLPQAVMYYRDEWLLEPGFHRFKRRSLPALPIYFRAPRPNNWLDVLVKQERCGCLPLWSLWSCWQLTWV
ncbi:MAG: hypothetical protein PUP91_16940 [Rhizonema sp. PD37]|nr:hypothetical protein [Rhizonema sp. PD37]